MQRGHYRIKSPTIALFYDDNGLLAIRMVPAGAVIAIEESGGNEDRVIDVIWEETKVMMFTRDLESRAERYLEPL